MDVRHFHTPDGGEVAFVAGQFALDDGLVEYIYQCLFGGNIDDSGAASDDAKQWWGNFDEPDPERILRSETQYLLRSLPATTGNLAKLEEAALRDVEGLKSYGATEITATASLPAVHRYALVIDCKIDNVDRRFEFAGDWTAQS